MKPFTPSDSAAQWPQAGPQEQAIGAGAGNS